MRIVVLLPAPLGPSRPTISPRVTVNEMPERAVRLPYRLVKLVTSIMLSFMDAALTSLPGNQHAPPTKKKPAFERRKPFLDAISGTFRAEVPGSNIQAPEKLQASSSKPSGTR